VDPKGHERKVYFDKKMGELQKLLLQMGGLVEESIARAVQSLKEQDLELAEAVYRDDDTIDEMESKIEEGCLTFIATQQPMAKDLRKISTLLKMVTNLERMADNAVNISQVTCRIGREPLIKPLVDIPRMTQITQRMVKDALDSYIQEDVGLAVQTIDMDDEVDQLNAQVFRELLTIMMENPRTITQATHLILVSRYLERIADHATNIAEEVIFLVTGEKHIRQ
jgi:phosphate transport system protein